MAAPKLERLSRAKILVAAVELASTSDIPGLRILLAHNPIPKEQLFRILLTYLPEVLDSTKYVTLLEDFVSENLEDESGPDPQVDSRWEKLDMLSEETAKRMVHKMKFLPLKWPSAPEDTPEDPLVLFLIHRSLRVDESTGLLAQIPELLAPFLHLSPYLRTWLISSVLPLLRLNYEYYPLENTPISIPEFSSLDDRSAVSHLLAQTGVKDTDPTNHTVGRDMRGLIGPWMYADSRWKRRKNSFVPNPTTPPSDEAPAEHNKYLGWEEVFLWITTQASKSWGTAVQVVEQWDGPGDVDYGGYEDGTNWVNEDDQQHLELRYARSIFATAYLVTDTSAEALTGADRMVSRLITLMDQEKLPSVQQAAALLLPASNFNSLLFPRNAASLRNDLLGNNNPLTKPTEATIQLLHTLVVSAFLCTRAGAPMSIRETGELVLLQDKADQNSEFLKFLARASEYPKQDEKYWTRIRNEILWLRDWGGERLEKPSSAKFGRGIFGQLPVEILEKRILETLLNASYTALAKSIYETQSSGLLPQDVLRETILTSAVKAYENATNANKTRGSVKKSLDIIRAFPHTLANSPQAEQLRHLIDVTHTMGNYKLVFRQGEPFKPVQLLVHSDPISIIGKILDQNPKSYSQISDLIDIGIGMVKSGLVSKTTTGYSVLKALDEEEVKQGISDAEKRVVSMCIDAALAEDDFETAYSYIVTRLKDIAGPAHARGPGAVPTSQGMFPDLPPKVIDDWSWRAALQSGKYRRSANTVKPTHLGNTNANPEIRHLEQRMECLSQALRLAPKATLQEILNVYRRCEEELESLYKREAEQEDAWDTEGDNAMPGGFEPTPAKKMAAPTRGNEEAPMSLFDLSRASAKRAQSGLASLASTRNNQHKAAAELETIRTSNENSRIGTPDSGYAPIRKRDQLRNVAVGGLASGVGWLIGAQPVRKSEEEQRE